MKNIMYKMKALTEALESVELNIIDAVTLIKSTVHSLEIINQDTDGMDRLIASAKVFANQLNIDADGDFSRQHRRRIAPRRFDDSSDN